MPKLTDWTSGEPVERDFDPSVVALHETLARWDDSPHITASLPTVAKMLRNAMGIPGLTATEHPGQAHQFSTVCLTCGRPGTLHIAVIAPGQTVRVEDPSDDR